VSVVVVFALTLFAAVLHSGLAERTVLSTAALFLAVGFVAGSVGLVGLRPKDPLVESLAELARFAVLFTGGMRVGVSELASAGAFPVGPSSWGCR
jgi:NhaP-type Na+/H+ and K+/H+ antiporter